MPKWLRAIYIVLGTAIALAFLLLASFIILGCVTQRHYSDQTDKLIPKVGATYVCTVPMIRGYFYRTGANLSTVKSATPAEGFVAKTPGTHLGSSRVPIQYFAPGTPFQILSLTRGSTFGAPDWFYLKVRLLADDCAGEEFTVYEDEMLQRTSDGRFDFLPFVRPAPETVQPQSDRRPNGE